MSSVRRILKYFRPYIGLFILALLSLTTLTILGLLRPKLTQILIDRVIYAQEIKLLPYLAAALIGISLLRGIFRYAQGMLSENVAMKAIADIRRDLFNHLMSMPYEYYDKTRTGELMSRISSDVHSLKHLLGNGLLELYDSLLTFSFVFVVLIQLNWQLTLLSLATIPFLFFTAVRFAYRIRPAYTRIREQMATMTTTIQENVTGVRVVKAFNNQNQEVTKFYKDNQENYNRRVAVAKIRAKYVPLMRLFGGLSALVVVWFGGYQVIIDKLTVGQLVEFYAYIWSLIWPIRRLGFLINFFERSEAAGKRIFEVLDTMPAIADKEDAVSLPVFKGDVAFNNVNFSYGENDVLQDINITVKAGQTVGIIGETGSGKSSLISLICRFYDVSNGSITIDGHDVRDLKLQDLRQQVGIVHQDIFLFSATIRENIAFGNPEATDEEIIKAAKIAQAHEFIMRMEKGYDTAVGERGIGLSGGQRQRIAIARSLVRNPKILILDDATSSVDMETEFAIQRDISNVLKNRTTFIIAHRISSIKDADIIYVFKQGRIIGQGTHQELIAKEGYYYSIFKDQFKERELLANYVASGGEE